jgi:hypothetical protein
MDISAKHRWHCPPRLTGRQVKEELYACLCLQDDDGVARACQLMIQRVRRHPKNRPALTHHMTSAQKLRANLPQHLQCSFLKLLQMPRLTAVSSRTYMCRELRHADRQRGKGSGVQPLDQPGAQCVLLILILMLGCDL